MRGGRWSRSSKLVVALIASTCSGWQAEAARFPDARVNGVEWFYVFGKDGNPYYGAETQVKKTFFLEVPKTQSGLVAIRVLDADVRGKHDEMAGGWNTSTRFAVFGGSKLLNARTITANDPDGTTVEFGPFTLEQGEVRDEKVVFRIEVEGIEGDDNNLFAFKVDPAQAQLFAFNPAIRLAELQGAHMRVYPEVSQGLTGIRAWNYDLDPDGGTGALLLPVDAKSAMGAGHTMYPVKNSESAAWARTNIQFPTPWRGGRVIYQITKATQPRANMSLRFEDERGKPLPIYFTPGEPVQRTVATCNTFEFDASKSYDPDNQQLTYRWDFGDGATADQMRLQHTYAQGGSYKAVLTVTDNSTAACRQSRTEQWIHVNTPPTAVIEAPNLTCAGSTVRLSAAKSSDTSGDRLAYRWDLGDGTIAEGAEVTHAYARGGSYPIALLVDDQQGTSCSRAQAGTTLRVNAPPIAKANDAIVMCSRQAGEPQAVTFDATASRDPDQDRMTYRWDFGDGATGEGAKATHRYDRGGRYLAKLLVDDGAGSSCSRAAATVPVTLNHAPVARATQETVRACSSHTFAFDASSSTDPDGDAMSYRWDFGDGETGTGAKVQHRYAKGGNYRVRLTTDDGTGMACAATAANLMAQVNSPPHVAVNVEKLGCVGQTLAFDATGSSDPESQALAYHWDFGDGTTADGARVQHAYPKGGIYPVTLAVDDGQGTPCSLLLAKSDLRINTPPIASAGPNLVCCREDLNAFDASKSLDADGDPLVYRWEFGDGKATEGAKVEHAYEKNGTYPVRVIVSDNSGSACNISSAGFVASVNAPPVAQMAVRGEGRIVSATAGEIAKQ